MITLALVIVGCTPPSTIVPSTGLRIATTFYPLYDIANSIAGDKAQVSSIVPPGVEPHEYEPTPQDIKTVANADVYVALGIESGIGALEQRLLSDRGNSIIVVRASDGIPLLEASRDDTNEPASGKDPHIWISPRNAQVMAATIADGLAKADPSNREYYLSNAVALRTDLLALDKEFTDGLASCSKQVLLANHDAYSYLAAAYGFRTVTISGLEPESEPSPGKIKELVDAARQYGIKYIMYEELVDPRIAKTIADDVGAQVLELSPLEGNKNADDTYVVIMRRNLVNLRLALECS